MKEYNVFIEAGKIYSDPVRYSLKLLSKNQGIKFNFLKKKNDADLIFDDDDIENSLPVATRFYHSLLLQKIYSFEEYFTKDCLIRTDDGAVDYLASVFYLVNCFQEHSEDPDAYDEFGRLKYSKTYQEKFDNIQNNIVQNAINNFCNLYLKEHILYPRRSRIFFSHDIDTINGALLQDGFWALRNKRIDVILKVIFHALVLQPDWKNMDLIMKIHDDYDIKSTFFWLVNKGKGSYGIKNADYNIRNLKPIIRRIEKNGFYNGIHKSCNDYSITDEAKRFPGEVNYNRFHFLRYKIPDIWEQLEVSPVEIDFSLGFAERYGFRNNYGLPFSPYNLKTSTAYSFIEVPLNMMDSTFHRYMKIPVSKTASEVISFMEKNEYNAVLTLLWHNTFFTKYKYGGFLEQYKKILGYFYDSKLDHITPPEIIKEFQYGE